MDTFKAKYLGEAETVEAFGVTFANGKAADVPMKYASKIAGNPFFETKDIDAKKVAKSEMDGDLKAEHHGGGRFNITRGEEVVQAGLSKADADAFNTLSSDEREAYVAKK